MAVIANIAGCNPHLKVGNRNAPFLTDGREPYPEDCDFLHGHFAYERIPASAVRFTFVRHPIARLSSCFYSLRQELRRYGVFHKDAKAVHLRFAGGISKTFLREQVWFLERIEDFIDAFLRTGGTFGMNFIPEILAPDYTRRYDYIGVTERIGESLWKLGRRIEIKTDPSKVMVVNASNSGEIRYRLKELTQFLGEQIETYQKICAMMP